MVAAANLLACDGHPIPPGPSQYVTDNSGLISAGIRARANQILLDYQGTTGHHVLVYVSEVNLGHTPIEDYCAMTFNAWGTGRAGHDDGVIWFLFPKGDRLRMRIQVGIGLERALTDREAVAILRKVGPGLESTNMQIRDVALENGVRAILGQIDGQ